MHGIYLVADIFFNSSHIRLVNVLTNLIVSGSEDHGLRVTQMSHVCKCLQIAEVEVSNNLSGVLLCSLLYIQVVGSFELIVPRQRFAYLVGHHQIG